jgi:hypothetical protein
MKYRLLALNALLIGVGIPLGIGAIMNFRFAMRNA